MNKFFKVLPLLLVPFCGASPVPAQSEFPSGEESYVPTSLPDFSVVNGEKDGEPVVIITYYNRLFATPASPETLLIETDFGTIQFDIYHHDSTQKEEVYAGPFDTDVTVTPPYVEVEENKEQVFIVKRWKGM